MEAVESSGSVTGWIRQLGGESHEPAARLWKRFEPRLVRYISAVIQRGPQVPATEDAIANGVFQSLVRLARRGDLSQTRRDGFWQLMKTIAARKVIDQRRSAERHKRGGGRVLQEAALKDEGTDGRDQLDQFPGRGLPPEVQAMAAESLGRIAELLDDEQREILILRMEGYTVLEIADAIGKSKATVDRRLGLIRATLQHWLEQYEPDDSPS